MERDHDKAIDAETRSGEWLAKGRAHEERGEAEKAERCFDKATYWLDRANKARGW